MQREQRTAAMHFGNKKMPKCQPNSTVTVVCMWCLLLFYYFIITCLLLKLLFTLHYVLYYYNNNNNKLIGCARLQYIIIMLTYGLNLRVLLR
jgi:hypothetical protein